MVNVEFFGLYRLNYKKLKHSIVIVNDVNINDLKKYRTKLREGDKVLIMSPASGG